MSDLHLTFAETGPIPNPQCALKDALLLALKSGETDAEKIAADARVFLDFLNSPDGPPPVATATITPMVEPEPASETTATDNLSPNGFPTEA